MSGRVKILSLVVEEERLGGLKVLIFLQVIFEFESQIVIGLGVGWPSNRSRADILEDQVQHAEGVLGVSINTEDVVDEGRSDLDVLGDQGTTFDFNVVSGESSGIEDILKI